MLKSTRDKLLHRLRTNHPRGMLGKKHTSETKRKMSESSKYPYNYIDGGYRGKIPTDKCITCGETKKRIMIHHIDGNRKNNDVENLEARCDKCHSSAHFPDGKIGKNLRGGKNCVHRNASRQETKIKLG